MCLACIHSPIDSLDALDFVRKKLKEEQKDRLARRAAQLQAKKIKDFLAIIDNTTMCSGGMDILRRIDDFRWELAKEI